MALDRLGLIRTTLLDYPGEVASVLFTAGCNLRCEYCHNPKLISGRPPEDFVSREEALAHLRKRSKVLGGAVITGGEPLLHSDLGELIDEIKALELKLKLDTNGTFPDRLSALNWDFLAMDVKGTASHYRRWGGDSSFHGVLESMDLLLSLGRPFELRCTWVQGIHTTEDAVEMADFLPPNVPFFLTPFRPGTTLNPSLSAVHTPDQSALEEICDIFISAGISAQIR